VGREIRVRRGSIPSVSVTGEPKAHPRDRLKRDLRLRDATYLVVSGVIGS
jgi:hypothetical protein